MLNFNPLLCFWTSIGEVCAKAEGSLSEPESFAVFSVSVSRHLFESSSNLAAEDKNLCAVLRSTTHRFHGWPNRNEVKRLVYRFVTSHIRRVRVRACFCAWECVWRFLQLCFVCYRPLVVHRPSVRKRRSRWSARSPYLSRPKYHHLLWSDTLGGLPPAAGPTGCPASRPELWVWCSAPRGCRSAGCLL